MKLTYECCASAALALAADGLVDRRAVREALGSVRRNPTEALDERDAALFPEIAAAVAGFAYSQRREDGLYALIDVGAGTLDCCTFNLVKRPREPVRCPIFVADVSPLGVERWLACQDDCARDEFRRQLRSRPQAVIWETRRRAYPNSPRWDTELPLFLIGGGAASEVHRAMADGLHGWLRHHLKTGRGGVRLLELPLPTNLECRCSHHQVHRLAVTVGLSLPRDLIPAITLPDDVVDPEPPRPADWESRYVDKSKA